MKEIILKTSIYKCKFSELSKSEKLLVKECKKIIKSAYAPYSSFYVGASVLLENGEIISGTNQENASYPSGLCAERVAVFYANAKFPKTPIKTILITAFSNDKFVKYPISPCGSCRQVLLESEMRFKKDIKVILFAKEEIIFFKNVKGLLPLFFDKIP
ncbi:MAG: cytidine deaminase [Bacteroidetes bacterium 4572_128]|nr:MAG: cytidine deaminase [Bacteroidetes bacterium 4572_128]